MKKYLIMLMFSALVLQEASGQGAQTLPEKFADFIPLLTKGKMPNTVILDIIHVWEGLL